MSDITIAALAAEARKHFTQDTRSNGDKFWANDVKDTDPVSGWIYGMVRDAHGDMMPDDYRYAFVVDALDVIADSDAETGDDARDSIVMESDIYTSDLLKWLASRNDRLDYCDQYADETDTNGTLERISGGQWTEKNEVLNSVINSLEAQMAAVANG